MIADHLLSFIYVDGAKLDHAPEPGQVLYQVDVIDAKPLDGMVTVAASEMAAGIAASGSITLYGILFDTNSGEVRPESAATLQEIAKLLKSQPSVKLLVVGHTDNVGTFEAAWTCRSAAAPNRTEEGRARNRRVQLVERLAGEEP